MAIQNLSLAIPRKKSVKKSKPIEKEEFINIVSEELAKIIEKEDIPERNFILDVNKGLSIEIERLELESKNAYDLYVSNGNGPNLKNWLDISKQWMNLAKIAPSAEREAGRVMKTSDVEAVWSRTFTEIRVLLDFLSSRISSNAAFKSLDPIKVEAIVKAEIQIIIESLSLGNLNK